MQAVTSDNNMQNRSSHPDKFGGNSVGRVLILTPTANYEERWQGELDCQHQALTAQGLSVAQASWTDPGDLRGYDVVLPLLAWGYMRDIARWNALLDRLEQECRSVLNPLALLRWNSDKAYLHDLVAQGVAVLPFLESIALNEGDIARAYADFDCDCLVIKPAISAGADGTFILRHGEAIPSSARGQRRLMQPFLPAIQQAGEYSLLCFQGVLSHSVVKHPKAGDFRVQEVFGGQARPCPPPDGAIALAQAALAACPSPPLYARIDMLADREGQLGLMELELIEPALYLSSASDSGAAFARAVAAALKTAVTGTFATP